MMPVMAKRSGTGAWDHWLRHALAGKCKSLIPFAGFLRDVRSRTREYSSTLDRGDWALEEGLLQVEWLKHHRAVEGATVLEVGSGWEPIIPLLFVAAGAKRVYLTDQRRLATPGSARWAIQTMVRHRAEITERLQISGADFNRAVSGDPMASGLDAYFDGLGLRYLAPCDCRHLDLPDGSVDIVTSRAVLEHIPADVIAAILRELHRILGPGGLACHFIDPSDHWEHVDKSISKINFLQHSDFVHGLIHSPNNYQNRLRHPEYVRMMKDAGFAVVREEREVDAASLMALNASLKLASRFEQFVPEDLATTNTYLLVRK